MSRIVISPKNQPASFNIGTWIAFWLLLEHLSASSGWYVAYWTMLCLYAALIVWDVLTTKQVLLDDLVAFIREGWRPK